MNKNILFEVSWEVCNKVGGINTVIASKAPVLAKQFGENHIFIGPDILDENENSDFIEDKELFPEWRNYALSQGLNVRVGRWNINDNPIAILIDFTSFFPQKNDIFSNLWEKFKLDSLNGQWDYIEPALFGYAAGKTIQSFYQFVYNDSQAAIAHFHEWMTGVGVLYLKENAPNIATVFTTHATFMGRVLAGNNMPLYSKMHDFKPHIIAKQFNITSKFSLEKAAAEQADVFTTVSNNTAKECAAFLNKAPEYVTPNGFDDSLVPQGKDYDIKRNSARKLLIKVSEAVLSYKLKNPFFVINSGRYEFRNKGIDVFIDSLNKLNKQVQNSDRDIVALITVPANNNGVNAELLQRLNSGVKGEKPCFTTHYLVDGDNDLTLKKIKELGITNDKDSRVKIIFAPVYLDGKDGIFNKEYYDLLIGFDLSVFPSYYEPWGYTPMESIAFKIPTVTTNLAGFGLWIQQNVEDGNNAARVIERNDTNYNESVNSIAEAISFYYNLNTKEYTAVQNDAFKLSRLTLWENLITEYQKAYKFAITEIENRQAAINEQMFLQQGVNFHQIEGESPNWKKALVKPQLPKSLQALEELANNLWWTWSYEAAALFKSIDPVLWKQNEFNPISLIESLDLEQIQSLEENKDFINKLNSVYSDFKAYMAKKSEQDADRIAYFSMEFGLHDTIKIFSGGLGILAGDFIKEASDNNVNMVAVGLLYRYGYFKQKITQFGDQLAQFSPQKFTHLPLIPVRNDRGEWISIGISLPGRVLRAKVWKINVGRVELYLLDTDIDENSPADRRITYQLYGGDHNNRFLQELLLGVGGIRLLDAIKSEQKMYHCNEGHAAMIGLERLRKYIGDSSMSFNEAKELVRASTLFTTHTPVPAGHDRFDEDLIRAYLPHYAERLNIAWDDFMALGRVNKDDHSEKFSMSILAAKLSQGMNGVSEIHGRVSQEMFADMFPGYYPNELYISYVTNGVHLPTWASKRWGKLYHELQSDFFEDQSNQDNWNKIHEVDDKRIFDLRNNQRKKLVDYLKKRLEVEMQARNAAPKRMLEVINNLRDDVLTIGFARRFATYKRAHLLFNDLDKLDKLVNNPDRPMQFIFAGKAHPADKAGQDLIKRIVEISKIPKFEGRIIFVENYDISLAKRLIAGVDVWLNNPTRPLEASGTSGEKAIMNGVLNFSVLDGWWAEGYVEGAGWALSEERTYDEQNQQDILDASLMYYIFEHEIAETFYDKDENGISRSWIEMIKKNIAEISPNFTMKRMIDDYSRKYYVPQIKRFKDITSDNYEKLKQLVEWKNKFETAWSSFEVVDISYPDSNVNPLNFGDDFTAKVLLRIGECKPENVGVEMVLAEKENEEVKSISSVNELQFVKIVEGVAQYEIKLPISKAGVFNFTFRVFPKHELLPHRQDFPLIKWI
jgi:phosphorylase/glycogen(starch) synthase